MFVNVLKVVLARNTLHDVSRHRGRVIRVGRRGARREDAFRQVSWQIGPQRSEVLGVADKELLRSFFEPCGVRHDVAQCNRLGISRRNPEIEIIVHVPIQVELALLFELHHGGPGKKLGNRSRAEQGIIDRYGRLLLDVGVSVPLREKHLSILHDRDHGAGNILSCQLLRHDSIEKGADIVSIHGWRAVCRRCGRLRPFGLRGRRICLRFLA